MNAVLEYALPSTNLSAVARHHARPHEVHPRLRHVSLEPAVIAGFLHRVAHVNIQNLQYVPFMRYMLAEVLEACAGREFSATLNAIVRDRATGVSHVPGFDYIAAAYAGAADQFGEADRGPAQIPLAIGDSYTGVAAAMAICAALLHRERTGDGQYLEATLIDSWFHRRMG
jgi:hypothetical protein